MILPCKIRFADERILKKTGSMAGAFAKNKPVNVKKMLAELRDKHDRF